MSHAGRRHRRLFCLVLLLHVGIRALGQGPTLTTVSDTLHRANGQPAAGTLLISWPPFTTADNHTVAAGNLSVTLGGGGSFTAQLAPNAGATPAGTVYTVVPTHRRNGEDGNWSVGTTSRETISQVRTLVGTSSPLGQLATQQYVNAALANVVHLSGTETITGVKQFTVSPTVPNPSQSAQAASKYTWMREMLRRRIWSENMFPRLNWGVEARTVPLACTVIRPGVDAETVINS